jgi:hypothetical protein
MSRDATLELLKSVRSALIADATVATAVSTRVATDWGSSLTAPFIRLSARVTGQFEDDAGDGSEYAIKVHVFAKEAGPVLSAQIAARVREVLQDAELVVTGADLWWLTYDQTIPLTDPDDPTLSQRVVSFNAVTTS